MQEFVIPAQDNVHVILEDMETIAQVSNQEIYERIKHYSTVIFNFIFHFIRV
jgi:hypothetical protein